MTPVFSHLSAYSIPMRHACLFVVPFVLLFTQCAPRTLAQPPLTTVFVVRHAEKLEPADPDSPISPEGEERARALAALLAKAGVTRIYATTKLRTQQTVAPLAAAREVEPVVLDPFATEDLVWRIRNEAKGEVVVVCGHSNTVPGIVNALCGQDIDGIPEEVFDRLFKVIITPEGGATLEQLRYGAPAP